MEQDRSPYIVGLLHDISHVSARGNRFARNIMASGENEIPEWCNPNGMAITRFDEDRPMNGSNFFINSPRKRSPSLNAFPITNIRIHGIRGNTCPICISRPSKNIPDRVDEHTANITKAIVPMNNPCLYFLWASIGRTIQRQTAW
jgi:hypothetical protein